MRLTPSVEVAALRRGDHPAERAATAVRRLIGVVAEWQPGAGLDLTIGSTGGRPGRVRVRLDSFGPTAPDWQSDAEWAAEHAARLKTPGPSAGPDLVSEVVVIRADCEFPLPAVDDDVTADWSEQQVRRREQRAAASWPAPRFNDLRGLLDLLAARPELAVRFRVAACTPVEAAMIADAVRSTWNADEHDVPEYLGRPIRLRAMLASRTGAVPPRLRTLARQWASNLRLVPVRGSDAQDLWSGDPFQLAGSVVPEGLAMGLVRLPVAGRSPVAGIRSESPSLHERPLDPVPPRADDAIRLGVARRVDTRRTEVFLAPADFMRHVAIDGSTGSGKSTMIRAILRGLAADPWMSYTLLEPHGEGSRQVAEETPVEARERTILIQHGRDDARFGLNILDRARGDGLTAVIDAFAELIADKDDPRGEGFVGPRWRRTLGIVAEGCAAALGSHASLVTVAAILSDMERVRQLARHLRHTDPELSHRLMNELGRLDGKEAVELTSWAVSKFHPMVSSARMRGILGTRTSVDVAHAMAEGQNLIIDLDSATLGVPGARMMAALWLLEHRMAMGAPRDPRRRHVIVCDEAHLYQYGALPSILAEGRKFGVGVVIATQDISQLRSTLAESLESNAGSYISLRAGTKAAMRSSLRLGEWPSSELTRLPDLTAAAVLSRDGVPTDPFTLHIDHNRRMAKAGMTLEARAASVDALAAAARERYSEPFRDVEPLGDLRLTEILTDRAEPIPREEPRATAARERDEVHESDGTATPQQTGRLHHLDEPGDFLDEWLARHGERHRSQATASTRTKGPAE